MDYTNHKIKLPELLAPAGSFEHLKTAIKAGADAVYMGGQRFGARAYADNFSKDDCLEALKYAHFYGRRLYLTVNTLMKENELNSQLFSFLLPYYEAGLDGVIVQDIGTASYIRRHFPDMEVHGSTQMTITSPEGAMAAARLGMNRVVPARELSLEEITTIKDKTGLEIEVFVHGALCYCYSGQCLFSSMYGHRSGNRGRCAQPCRLSYTLTDKNEKVLSNGKQHLLSPKDLCSLSSLPELVEAGVDSLKVEGRMKNIEYVAGVTSMYRKYLDRIAREYPDLSSYKVDPEDVALLEDLYVRDGFTKGYWNKHNGKDMMAVTYAKNMGHRIGKILSIHKNQLKIQLNKEVTPKDILVIPASDESEIILTVPGDISTGNHIVLNAPKAKSLQPGMSVFRRYNAALQKKLETEIVAKEDKLSASAYILLQKGSPAGLSLTAKNVSIYIEGPIVEESKNRPVTLADVEKQLKKTGNVPFQLTELVGDIDDQAFFPASFLKDMRQKGYELLQAEIMKQDCPKRNVIHPEDTTLTMNDQANDNQIIREKEERNKEVTREKIVSVYDMETFNCSVTGTYFDAICIPWEHWKKEDLISLAKTIKEEGKKAYLSLPRILRGDLGIYHDIVVSPLWDGVYAHNVNGLEYVRNLKENGEYGGGLIAGSSVYVWNHNTADTLKEMYGSGIIFQLPEELSYEETQAMIDPCAIFEYKVYARPILMLSAQCLKKTCGLCDHKPETLWLEDHKGRKLPVSNHCAQCSNTIWFDRFTDRIDENFYPLSDCVHRYFFDFYEITKEDQEKVMSRFNNWADRGFLCNAKKQNPEEHWNFGIE